MTTTYERFAADDGARRLLNQENLILEVTEELCRLMSESNVSRSDLAQRMGKSKGSISRLLSGDRNLTLRTIADLADSLEGVASFKIQPARRESAQRECQVHWIGNWNNSRPGSWQMPAKSLVAWPDGASQPLAAA